LPLSKESGAARRGLICLLIALAAFPVSAKAQGLEAQISVVSLSPPLVKVEGRLDVGATPWSFRNSYAGVLGLAERVENFTLADARGAAVPIRKLAPGEYEAARPATAFVYEVKLEPPPDNNSAPHVSWLAPNHGLLMGGDLLPLPTARARLRLTLPAGWTASPSPSAALTYNVDDAESAVFLVGRGVRERRANVRGSELTVAFAGDWAFEDQDAVEVVTQVLNEHARSFGAAPRKSSSVIVAPHPRQSAPSQWSAEARGGNVTFLTGRAPTKQSALARLTGPLAHELFHLWVPNALRLAGEYDWFYEGFAVYQALRIGVRLGHINFNDYLDALAGSYDLYRREAARDGVSLIDSSLRRWSGSNAMVYHKGALVAFLYDMELRRSTGGKRTLDDAFRELFRGSQTATAPGDANAVVTAAMDALLPEETNFTSRYVRSVCKINLAEELRLYGLTVNQDPSRTRITVSASLNRLQRALLRQIGYN
jgi:hypothetical protein